MFSKDWNQHLQKIKELLSRLDEKGFSVNPAKCEWGVKETDFLGHWLTPKGIKPWYKKVKAIVNMSEPTNLREVRAFLGLVTYYRDMWPHRSHILTPLTDLIGKKSFQWGEEQRKAFQQMKALVAGETLLAYPDHNKPFVVETDASDYQLGAVIKQEGQPVAFYSRKLNSAQKNYTTIEKELLSIVETLKAYRTMLLGARIEVYTDHKNLTHQMTQFSTQRVMRWRLILEEYDATYHYKTGESNFFADALSRVPTSSSEREEPDALFSDSFYNDILEEEVFHTDAYENESSLLDICPALAEVFTAHPKFDDQGRHPFNFETLVQYQNQSATLKDKLAKVPEYQEREYGNTKLICYVQPGQSDKIVLTKELVPKLVKWYHEAIAHVEGVSRMEEALCRNFYHPRLKDEIKKHVLTCDDCQKYKRGSRQYGHLAPRDANVTPWQEIHCDTIGPWKIELRAKTLEFKAVTIIDPVTNLVEINPLITKTAKEVADAVETNWICRYPRPLKCLSDQGPEFQEEFTRMLEKNGIEHSTSTARNPQGNSIVERIHQAIGNVLRIIVATEDPKSVHQAKQVINKTLALTMKACRCATNGTIGGYSAGALAFKRDMLLDIPLVADIITLRNKRQDLIDKRLLKANASRISHDYKVDEEVLKKEHLGLSDKLKPAFTGPYNIIQIHTNGTVTIRLSPNQSIGAY